MCKNLNIKNYIIFTNINEWTFKSDHVRKIVNQSPFHPYAHVGFKL